MLSRLSATTEVSRETIEAGTRVLAELAERDLSALDVLVVYVDGIVFGDYHVSGSPRRLMVNISASPSLDERD